MNVRLFSLLLAVALPMLGGCNAGFGARPCDAGADASILAVGDSILAFNSGDCASIPNVAADQLGVSVQNNAVTGAKVSPGPRYIFGSIAEQYEPGNWDWVIVEGGINDLNQDCGCDECGELLDSLSSPDGSTGDVPALVGRAVADGASVALMGYYPVDEEAGNGFGRCNPATRELNRRYAALAATRPEVVFINPGDAVTPDGLADAYRGDGVHPTQQGSKAVGGLLADVIAAAQ